MIKKYQLILGLLIGQMILRLSDREIVDYFHENLYFHYFCGQDTFAFKLDKAVIHHSLLSKRRRRLGNSYIKKFEKEVLTILIKKDIIKCKTLMLDATVFPSNITYPNDVKLLNTARDWFCETILKIKNVLDPKQKGRTYRKKERKVFLTFQKTK